ncbi:MAG: RNA polymerase sigma factor [Bdellovibrio sp.]
MGDSEVRALALFFFFASLDEYRAKETASKAADEYERILKKDPKIDPAVGVILASYKVWIQFKSKIPRGRPQFSNESGWLFVDKIDLGHWKEFQKTAPEDELLALIWVHILGFSEEQVSRALGLTEGTLRYRVGRGLRKLGTFLAPTGRSLKAIKST